MNRTFGRGRRIKETGAAGAEIVLKPKTGDLEAKTGISDAGDLVHSLAALELSRNKGNDTDSASGRARNDVNEDQIPTSSGTGSGVQAGSQNEPGYESIPQTLIEAAKEFREDATIAEEDMAKVMSVYFFCGVCGCPADTNCYTCTVKGHPVCKPCQSVLNFVSCPYLLSDPKDGKNPEFCTSRLVATKSKFRKFMLQETIVGCCYRSIGCTFQDIWEKVKEHQEVCEYNKKRNVDNGGNSNSNLDEV